MARILIADDNPDVRDLLVAIFRLRGHDPAAFSDGPGLLDELRARPADLCLIDWMMPGMDGPEVLARLRGDADPRVAATHVAMLTSADRSDLRFIARRGGAETFLNKSTPLVRLLTELSPFLSPH